VVITPNHVSFMDPVLVTIPIHRPVYYLALEPFFRIPVLGTLMRWARALPVRHDDVNRQVGRMALRLLRAGEPLMVFPEASRTRDGRLQPFHPGAFRLAMAVDAPVVPVTIRGAFEAWPVGRRLPRRGRIRITYHPPLTRKDLPAELPRQAQPEALAELARQRIAATLEPDAPSRCRRPEGPTPAAPSSAGPAHRGGRRPGG
jgi:1-acyl-sn-glycerol-3-phosphate acyltransferase